MESLKKLELSVLRDGFKDEYYEHIIGDLKDRKSPRPEYKFEKFKKRFQISTKNTKFN